MNEELEMTVGEEEIAHETAEKKEIAGEAGESEDKDFAAQRELSSLREELSRVRGVCDRFGADCSEFASLYPDVALSSIPDSVWESAAKGIPLAAAYALSCRRAEMAAAIADGVNHKNRALSVGSVGGEKSEDFFSPAEVRAMTQSEVRANYSKIISSMSKWH